MREQERSLEKRDMRRREERVLLPRLGCLGGLGYTRSWAGLITISTCPSFSSIALGWAGLLSGSHNKCCLLPCFILLRLAEGQGVAHYCQFMAVAVFSFSSH